MNRRIAFLLGFAVVFLSAVLACGCSAKANESVTQFKKYLEEKSFSVSGDVCTMIMETETDGEPVRYTEAFDGAAHTFTATWLHDASPDGDFRQMEYIYDYAAGTVTMNRYDSKKSRDEGEPNTVLLLNREEMPEWIKGEASESESETVDSMLHFKEVFRGYLAEAGLTVDDLVS